jgi:serine/threonine-protein kinase
MILGAPPKSLGRFEVGAKIGGGGMATVYLGRAVEDAEQLVALKVMRHELADNEDFRAMFIDEAKILSRLSHPNIIRTLEYGVTGDHRFIAMELLSGRTAADVWEAVLRSSERLDLGLAAWLCARVAEGLHAAHEAADEDGLPLNVVHRDVNPTNIFLTHGGEVKLIDFGLARARVRLSRSVTGVLKGKIPYLAPEQIQGVAIDRRIDVYALGTTLWEMATMRRLFKRDTDVDTLLAIREANVPDPRREVPGFPDALWTTIDRALRRDPDERFATADAMRAELDAFARDAGANGRDLAALLVRLFPGDQARESEWLRGAASVRGPTKTLAPPVPVPMASSSLLEADDHPSSASLAAAPAHAPSVPGDALPPFPPASERRREERRDETSVVDPPEDRRRLWMIAAGVVALLVGAAILTSR